MKSFLCFPSRGLLALNQRAMASKIKRQLPVKDSSLEQHDPELFKLLE